MAATREAQDEPRRAPLVMGSSGPSGPFGSGDGVLQLLVFTLHDSQYALLISAVERVVRVVEMTPLPRAPEIVLGIVNLAGRVIPVVNVRRRFGHPQRAVQLSDQLIVARTSRRPVALLVDRVESLIERAEREIIEAREVLPGLEYVRGVAKLAGGLHAEAGLVLIHDLDAFLSLEEEQRLGEALSPARSGGPTET